MVPKLEFVIHERLIAAYAIRHHGTTCAESIAAFRTAARRISPEAYQFVRYPNHTAFVRPLAEQAAAADAFLDEAVAMPEFLAVLAQAREARERVIEEWERMRERTACEVLDITGVPTVGKWQVYITPPTLGAGTNTGEGITWTYRDDWPHYNAVYLWHEILHSKFGTTELEHAVIELIADNELRVRLNGGMYPPWEGHPHLHPLRGRLLEPWRKYLPSPFRNIYDFVRAAVT